MKEKTGYSMTELLRDDWRSMGIAERVFTVMIMMAAATPFGIAVTGLIHCLVYGGTWNP
jgi:hypothetical protein